MDEYGDILLPPLGGGRTEEPQNTADFFIGFLNRLEGWKTKCKNLHWAAPKRNIHEYLDQFLEILQEYQDGLAEGYMGILGKMMPNAIKGISSDALNAIDFIDEVRGATVVFYDKIPKDTVYKGITSECETFIQNINKYKYLFGLCDVRPY